ncbi:MAG: HD protein [Gammaproteobacteria bacterium]|nr:HD protein [Gammaproteobacteria bacterium]
MRDEKIEQLAAQHYDPKLQYHNFDHIRFVLGEGEKIIARCKKEGVEVNEAVIYYAILFHDAGFLENHMAKGFDSKEAYSADLAVKALRSNGMDADIIRKVEAAIMATHVDAICKTNEDKAVRAADLAGLAADYSFFKKNTIDLRDEYEMMSGKKITWNEWKTMASERVELFLREELYLTTDYYNERGESRFHVNTRTNIQKLLHDRSERLEG